MRPHLPSMEHELDPAAEAIADLQTQVARLTGAKASLVAQLAWLYDEMWCDQYHEPGFPPCSRHELLDIIAEAVGLPCGLYEMDNEKEVLAAAAREARAALEPRKED